jgi:hypothetical protein
MVSQVKKIVVLVHGWSVTTTATYGGLADTLEKAAQTSGLQIDIRNIYLSKYVSFKDEVRLEDISRAFEAAVQRELMQDLGQDKRFICITHSTGGPVIRDWLTRFYVEPEKPCPLSHLIMLAPANFGSALAQLGKKRLGRIKAWFQGVEPGKRVLNWLELGSPASMDLNLKWIKNDNFLKLDSPIYSFVISGDSINRKLYDHVNPYTGEIGSDGVVRLAAANLNATYVKLEQIDPTYSSPTAKSPTAKELVVKQVESTDVTAFKILHGMAHSGDDMGIMKSVGSNDVEHSTVAIITKCLAVDSLAQYEVLKNEFDNENQQLQDDPENIIEIEKVPVLPNRVYFRDPHSMVIFRLIDHLGEPLSDLDLKLTAGARNSPDALPKGFFSDRQRNNKAINTLTFFLNYAAMNGCRKLEIGSRTYREEMKGAENYGIKVDPFNTKGFVHYLPCRYTSKTNNLIQYIKPNQTTIIDIIQKRIIRRGVFELTRDRSPGSFKKQPAGKTIPF